MNKTEDAARLDDGHSGGEIASAVVLFVLQVVIALPFYFITLFLSLAMDGCTEQKCNVEVAVGAIYIAPIAALCALAITIPLTIRAGKRGGSVIVPPLLGVISVIIIGILGIVVNHLAVRVS